MARMINKDSRWEEIINFTDIRKDGVDIDELLAVIERK